MYPGPLLEGTTLIGMKIHVYVNNNWGGIGEIRNSLDRLYKVLERGSHASAQEICNLVWEALETYRQETDQHDDVTLFTVRVE